MANSRSSAAGRYTPPRPGSIRIATGSRTMRNGPALALVLLAVTLMDCTGGRMGSIATRAPVSGRVDSFQVSMPELGGRARTVRVFLPRDYETGQGHYPVLYLQDAQQLFAPGPFGDWQVDEHLDHMVESGRLRGLIVVGVDNSAHRWDEYGPWVNRQMRAWVNPTWSQPVQGGEGDAYISFLAGSLKPMIDARYRSLPDREHTGIGGSSMGGLIALHAGLTRPDVFSRVMAMSTAVWFGEDGGPWLSRNRLVSAIHDHPVPADVRFYLDVGTSERSRDTDPDVADAQGHHVTYPRAYQEGSEAVATALLARGVPAANLRHVLDRGGIHHESAWSARFEDAVAWLYR